MDHSTLGCTKYDIKVKFKDPQAKPGEVEVYSWNARKGVEDKYTRSLGPKFMDPALDTGTKEAMMYWTRKGFGVGYTGETLRKAQLAGELEAWNADGHLKKRGAGTGESQGGPKQARLEYSKETINAIAEAKQQWERNAKEVEEKRKHADTEEKLFTVQEEQQILAETKPWEKQPGNNQFNNQPGNNLLNNQPGNNPLNNDDLFRFGQ